MRARRAAAALLLLGAAVAGAIAGAAVLDHERARAAYEAEARAVGSDGYDARRSDARYAEVVAARDRARHPAWTAGALLLVGLVTSFGPRAARPIDGPAPRAVLAPDVVVAVAGLVAAGALPDALGVEHAALAVALRPALAAAGLGLPIGAIAAGQPLGGAGGRGRVALADGRPPGPALASAALLVAALTFPWTVGSVAPPALRWLGLHAGRG